MTCVLYPIFTLLDFEDGKKIFEKLVNQNTAPSSVISVSRQWLFNEFVYVLS